VKLLHESVCECGIDLEWRGEHNLLYELTYTGVGLWQEQT